MLTRLLWAVVIILAVIFLGALKMNHISAESFSSFSDGAYPISPSKTSLRAKYVPHRAVHNPTTRVINCLAQYESSGRHFVGGKIIRGRHGEYGYLQFLPSTFRYYNRKYGFKLSVYKKQDQIRLAKEMLERDERNIWEWATAKYCVHKL